MEKRSQTRLLFDEDVSPRVARALYELGFHVFHVGQKGQPEKRTKDPAVLDHAIKCNQVVVTRNHDMIMLCAERGVSVVWLDPHGTRLSIDRQAALAFGSIRQWTDALEGASEAVCVRALRTRVRTMPVADGADLAAKRYYARQKREAARKRTAKPTPRGQTEEPSWG